MPKKTSQPRRSTLVNAEDDSVLTKRKGVPLKEKEGPTTRPNLNTLPLSSDQERSKKKVKSTTEFANTLPLINDDTEETKDDSHLAVTSSGDDDWDNLEKPEKKKKRYDTRAKNDKMIGKYAEGSRKGGSFKINRKNYERQIEFPADTHEMLSSVGKKLYKHRGRPAMGAALTRRMLESTIVSKTPAGDKMQAQFGQNHVIPKMSFMDDETGEKVSVSRNHKIADSQITRVLYDMTTGLANEADVDSALKGEKGETLNGFFKAFGIEDSESHINTIKDAAKLLKDDPSHQPKTIRDTAAHLNGISNVLSLSDHNLRFGYSVPNTLIGNSADPHIVDGAMTPISRGLTNSIVNLGNVGLINQKLALAATQTARNRLTDEPITSDTNHKFMTDKQVGLIDTPKDTKKKGGRKRSKHK